MAAGGGELIASAVFKLVFDKLGSTIWQEIGSQLNLRADLEGLRTTLDHIQRVLRKAEKRSIKDGEVCVWMRKLKFVAYDMEDMLIDCEYQISLSKTNDSQCSSTTPATNGPIPHNLRRTMPDKLKEMKRRLEEILHLKRFDLDTDNSSDNQDVIQTLPTGPIIGEGIVGRVNDKAEIMELLKRDHEHCIIPIYGFAGLGKTSLAQMVYNDSRIGESFDIQAWVHVSTKFDIAQIGRSIISQVDGQSNQFDLPSVQKRLQTILAENRSLIILDDLWEENAYNLERLRTMLRGGKPGSKVIVTTRSERIAKRMNSKLPFKLDALPGEDCWNLFRTMAFPAGVMDPQTLEKEKVGQQIVERCRGVPLAVKSLAYRLQNEPLRRWEETLKSDLWEEEQNPTSATRSTAILPSLKLSYYYMPEYLRPCFAYFAVFPKGFVVEKISLIQRWTALGFVAPTHHPDDYLQELVGMSFLQAVSVSPPISQRYCKPPSTLFQMHDLVHQLAMSVSSDEVAVSDGSRGGRSCLKMENCRYMLFSNFNGLAPQRNGMPSKARAIHFKDCTALKPSPNIFSKTEWLRVLDLSGLGTGELPESMKNLHHLQVLNLSENTCLTKLPSLICDFQKLSYLDLHSCSSIIELPESIHKLNELIYLDLSKCSSLRELPMNSRGLQKLSSLNLSGCSQLEKLPDTFGYLKNLKDLNMSFCCQLKQLQTGFFNDMKEIRFLNMQGCSNVRELPDSIRKVEELRYMDLSNCSSICKLPTITGGLQKLYSLNLSGCSQLEKIPDTFGCLKNLKDLNMSCCCRLKQLPADFFKDMKEIRYLNFSGCASLWELPELGGNNRGHLLEMLDLSGCAELSGLPESYSLLSELQHLNLSGCSKLQNITVFLARHKLFRLEYLNLSGVGLKGDSELVGTSSGQGSQNPKAELWQLSLLHGLITQSLAHLKYLSVGGYTLFSEQGIATLEDLQTLPIFRVRRRDKDGGSNIVLLGKILDATQRDLHIECLENVVTPEEIDKVEIGNKQLHSLTLEWSSGISQFECKAKKVLEKLRPHRDLQVLTIKGYGEDTFPDWIMTIDDALPNLVKIVLSDVECKDLPPLGNMPNLQDLEIRNVHCLDFSLIGRWQNLRRLSLIALRDTTLKLNVDGNEYEHIPRTEYDMPIDDGRTKRKCKEIYEKVKRFSKEQEQVKWFWKLFSKQQEQMKRFWKLFSKEPGHTEETEAAMPMPEANAELARFSSDKNPELPILEHLEIESCLNLEFYPWMPKSAQYSITHSTRKFEDTEPFIRFNLTRETFYGRPETFYERAQRSTINIRCSPPTSRSWIRLVSVNTDILFISKCEEIMSLAQLYSEDEKGGWDPSVSYINYDNMEALFVVRPMRYCRPSGLALLHRCLLNFPECGILTIKNLENMCRHENVFVEGLSRYEWVHSLSLEWFVCNKKLSAGYSRVIEDATVDSELRPPKSLRTLRIKGYLCAPLCSWMMNTVLPNLEELELEQCSELINLPETIRSCHSLRKLKIVDCWNFEEVPEWLGELRSLQELKLHAAKLERLPPSIQNLTALESLVLTKCNCKLRESLARDGYNRVVITEGPEVSFRSSEVVLLQQTTSSKLIELIIKDLACVTDLKEIENLGLPEKRQLRSLTLDWCDLKRVRIDSIEMDRVVLEKLQPHGSLEVLCIKNYARAVFPRWMSSLRNLVRMELSCVQFRDLHLDQLFNLEELHISQIYDVWRELSIWCTRPLGKLRRIVMSEIKYRKFKISQESGGSDENLFPGLQDLEMDSCEEIEFEPYIPRSARYIIGGTKDRVSYSSNIFPSFDRVMGLPTPGSTSKMIIKNCYLPPPEETLKNLQLLDIAELTTDSSYWLSPDDLLEHFRGWTSLKKTEVLNPRSMETLPQSLPLSMRSKFKLKEKCGMSGEE